MDGHPSCRLFCRPEKDAPAKKITKINVDQILPDSTRWVNSDTVIYTPDGRLAQVDFIHFCSRTVR